MSLGAWGDERTDDWDSDAVRITEMVLRQPPPFTRGVEICEWTPRAEDIWDTECRKFFTFSDGTLAENGFEFCPFCGGAIIIQNEGDS